MAESTAPPLDKIVEKGFRLKESEDAQLRDFIQYAHEAHFIAEPTLQAYMLFCLNVTAQYMKNDFLKTGLKPK